MKTKGGPLCAVTIGFQTFLMPVASGMKLVQIFTQAVDCDESYDGSYERKYTAGKQVAVHFTTVRDDQVRLPDAQPKGQKVVLLEAPK
ncbi:hypothetical protein L2Y94_06515 [Luteibacter aegosomatis]|uniref:hypothetical protein n=1 Tax=Luteibacter aegosomatis TaxID=2911537 RepID=UPI001FFBA62E|nr:hypothetical protein [Luteibacter aegosomatis]UPG87004.1 hypothetical protein L2Y94_06515 [Luteibacter aegosomatis]